MEATILQWLKEEGEMIREEDSIVEVGTDKVDSEVPTPYAGTLQKILVQTGEVVKVGAPIAIINTTDTVITSKDAEVLLEKAAPPKTTAALSHLEPSPVIHPHVYNQADGRFYSPLVRHIAQQEDIPPQELSQLPGTGKGNRVTKRDILAYLQHRLKGSIDAQPMTPTTHVAIAPEDEVIQLDRVRQMIAKRMVASKHIAAHVTSFVEADVTELVAWRNRNKGTFDQKTNTKLTYTSLFLQAIVRAIQDFPMINAFVVEDRIIKKKAINIGLAVALPDGNLIVPVIKNAAQLSLAELADQVQTLTRKARNHQLVPDELAGATYTVSNLGSFHNLMGTPIIMQPQVAILALGAIVKKPAVVASDQGDIIAIRHTMYLSHSYDHRVIDGALGGGFVKQVAKHLETFVNWVSW